MWVKFWSGECHSIDGFDGAPSFASNSKFQPPPIRNQPLCTRGINPPLAHRYRNHQYWPISSTTPQAKFSQIQWGRPNQLDLYGWIIFWVSENCSWNPSLVCLLPFWRQRTPMALLVDEVSRTPFLEWFHQDHSPQVRVYQIWRPFWSIVPPKADIYSGYILGGIWETLPSGRRITWAISHRLLYCKAVWWHLPRRQD